MVDIDKLQNKIQALNRKEVAYNQLSHSMRPDWQTTEFKHVIVFAVKHFIKSNIKHTVYYIVTVVPIWANMINDVTYMPYSLVGKKTDAELKQDYFDYLVDQEDYNGVFEDVNWALMWRSDLTLMFNKIDQQENLENGVKNEANDFITCNDFLDELSEAQLGGCY